MVADTVVLALPDTGDMEETVAVALLTTNRPLSLLPSGFWTTRFHVPGSAPKRLNVLLIRVGVSVPATAPVMAGSPLRESLTVGPENPDSDISMVCEPVLAAPPGRCR